MLIDVQLKVIISYCIYFTSIISQYILLPIYSFIRLFVISFDVIHTLGFYSFGIKIDAIPGRINLATTMRLLWKGEYRGKCFELCGQGHLSMLMWSLVIRVYFIFNCVIGIKLISYCILYSLNDIVLILTYNRLSVYRGQMLYFRFSHIIIAPIPLANIIYVYYFICIRGYGFLSFNVIINCNASSYDFHWLSWLQMEFLDIIHWDRSIFYITLAQLIVFNKQSLT